MSFKGRNIVKDYDTKYNWAFYAWNAFFPRAEEDLRYYLGDQWTEQERQALFDEGRTALTINRIKPNVNMITGYQRKHRLSSVVVPQSPEDQQVSDQISKILLHVFQAGDFYEAISDAFEGSVITGWNMLSLWMDYRDDPLGQIKVSREPYNAFITDPYFSKRDLSDCSYILRRKYISLEQAISLLPEDKNFVEGLYKKGPTKDDKFTWLPYQRLPSGQTMMAYDEYWEQDFERKKVIIDMRTGDEFAWTGDDSILLNSPDFQILEKEVPVVYQHIIVNGNYIKTEKNPFDLNEYPFVPFLSLFAPESDQWALKIQSVVRMMKGPQKDANKRRSQLVDLIEGQLNSGWIAEDGSVINPRSLFQTGQGRVVWRKKGSDPSSLVRLNAADVPQSFFQATDLFDRDVQFVANVSEELLATADNAADSGLKVGLRQSAALVGLQGLFDNLRFSQKLLSRKTIKLMQNFPIAKLKKILQEDPDPRITDQSNLRYDISVQEGILTTTQQQMFFNQLITLKQLGEPVPPGLLAQAAPLQGKTEYNKAIQEFNQQQQQAAQSQAELQQQLLQSEKMLSTAQAISDLSLAKERISKSEMDKQEKAAKTIDDRADAELRRIESLKRLEELDDNRLERLLGFLERLDSITEAQIAQVKNEAEVKSASALNTPQIQNPQEVEGGI